ncbi:hypothetical protein evm_010711 [Chilo suppressalis]|nr:hypothetical protein evm_010711 [Chilo suppressalis]
MTTRLEEIERLFQLLDQVEDPICINCDSPSHGTAVIVQEISRRVANKDGTTKKKRKILIRTIHITGIPN